MDINKVLVVYTIPRNKEQKSCLDIVKKVLARQKVKFALADRDKLTKSQFASKDLVVAVGGDGTFLRAVQFMKKGAILGVNADPKNKEGFFMKSNRKNFEEILKINK